MEDHNITSPNTVGTSKADINPAIAECKFTVEKKLLSDTKLRKNIT